MIMYFCDICGIEVKPQENTKDNINTIEVQVDEPILGEDGEQIKDEETGELKTTRVSKHLCAEHAKGPLEWFEDRQKRCNAITEEVDNKLKELFA